MTLLTLVSVSLPPPQSELTHVEDHTVVPAPVACAASFVGGSTIGPALPLGPPAPGEAPASPSRAPASNLASAIDVFTRASVLVIAPCAAPQRAADPCCDGSGTARKKKVREARAAAFRSRHTYIHTHTCMHACIHRARGPSRVAPAGARAAGRRRAVTSKRPRPARPPAGPANEVDPKWTGSGPGPVQCDPVRSSAGPVLVRSTAIHCGRRTRPSERAGFGWPVGELCGVQFNNL